MIEQGSLWSQVASLVEAGQVRLDPGVAQRCAQHCSHFREQLEALQSEVRGLTRIEGMGTLPSGIALAQKFSLKASGGAYSMDQALADHIAEVQRMQQVFGQIEAMYGAAEESAAQGIMSAGAGL